MDAAHRLDALRIEGAAAARGAEGRLGLDVPNLGWTVGDVLRHLGGVHHRFTGWLRRQPQPPSDPGPAEVDDEELVAWYRRTLNDLVTTLGATTLDDRFTTWAGDRDGHWVLRRMANETVVHRWDVEAAGGSPEPIPAAHAADVIEELVTDLVALRGPAAVDELAARDGLTLHLHATDDHPGDDAPTAEWLLTASRDGLTVDHRHGKGDVALRGPTGDLALWAWGRIPSSRLEAFGEPELVDWWSRALRFG